MEITLLPTMSAERKVRQFQLSSQFLDGFRGRQPDWDVLGYFTYARTYSRKKPDGTNEEYWETVQRVVEGVYNLQKQHCKQTVLPWNDAKAQKSAQEMYQRIWDFKFTPPGRGFWMMGTDYARERSGAALNNCAFCSTETIGTDFSTPFTFLMDMSMLGVGVGGDTRGKGKVKLQVPQLSHSESYEVQDSREGWVSVTGDVLDSFVGKFVLPATIDFTPVRLENLPIKGFGGTSSGPGPLIEMLVSIINLLLPPTAHKTSSVTVEDLHYDENGVRHGPYIRLAWDSSTERVAITGTQIVDIFNFIGKAVVAGNVRRSAEIMFSDINDREFLALKDPSDLIRLSGELTETNTFRTALLYAHEQLEAPTEDDNTALLAALSEVDAKIKRIEDQINSHPLRDRRWASNNSVYAEVGSDYSGIVDAIAANGEPGVVWLNNARRYARMNGEEDDRDQQVMGFNPCVTGDTIIFTSEGPKTALSLLDKPFYAVVDGKEHYSATGVFATGNKPVYDVKTKEGYTVRVTGDHQILMCPKLTSKKRYETWVESQDLAVGDKIILNNVRGRSWSGEGTFNEGWLLGSLVGDGHFANHSQSAMLTFWGETKEHMLKAALSAIEELGGKSQYHSMRTGTEVEARDQVACSSRKLWERAVELEVSSAKTLGRRLLTTSSDFQAGFVRGIFDADGCVQGTQDKGCSVRLSSVTLNHLETVQSMLLNLGVVSTIYKNRKEEGLTLLPDGKGGNALYPTQASHDLVIANDNLPVFNDRVGFADPLKSAKLTSMLASYRQAHNRERFVATVESVTYVGLEDVFDCTVDTVHRFGANGITVHNCSEQQLQDMELCCLVETYPARHDSYEDFQRTLKFAYLYAKTVTLAPTHFPRTNAVMMKNRRIGCSMSGIVQAVEKFGRRNFFEMCDKGYDAIQRYDKTYSNWLGIPRSVRTTSVKPSGTVSLLAGATPGVHYPHSEYYIRRVRVQDGSPLIAMLQKAGYHVEPDKYSQMTQVVSFPIHEKFFKKGKADVTIWEQFALVAAMQSLWADNAVSATITFKPEEAKDIKTCLETYENQLKAVSLLPLETHGYVQAPYEAITKEQFEEMTAKITPLDYDMLKGTAVHEVDEKFCTNDVCEIKRPT